MIQRLRGPVGLAMSAMLVVAACGGSTTPSPGGSTPAPATTAPSGGAASAPPAAGDQRLAFADFETVDNNFAVETDDAVILTAHGIAETLVRTNFDGELEPYLATEWSRTDDLNWEFTIREGVTFHDGTPLDAAVVAASLSHLLTVEAPARSFNPNNIASVTASGPNSVTLTTTQPNSLAPLYVASFNTVILSPAAYTADGINPMGTGTGPFVMTAQNLPQGYTLDRNDSYWGGDVALAGVDVRLVPDGNTRMTMVQTGEVQAARSAPVPLLPVLEANPDLVIIRGQLSRTNMLKLNNSRAPLNDVKVRQAIQSAIDVDAIANVVLEGAVAPAVGPFAPNNAWAPAGASTVPLDVDKAKGLLAEAGVAEGTLTLGLWAYPSRAELPDVAVAIQAMLAAAGITTEVRVADYAALEPDALGGNFDMMLLSRSYLTDIADPSGFLRADFTCAGTYNISHFCDAAVDEAIAGAVVNEDPAARYAVYADIATQLQGDAVDVYLYNPQELAVTTTKVQNYRVHPMEHYLLTPQLSLAP